MRQRRSGVCVQRLCRHAAIGYAVGALCSPILLATAGMGLWASLGLTVLCGLVGAAYVTIGKPGSRAYVEEAITGATLGVAAWMMINVIAQPVLTGHSPLWTATGMRSLFSVLIGWILFGVLLGWLTQLAFHLTRRWDGLPAPVPTPPPPTRIVIVGGGFAGVTTAQHLERVFAADPTVSFTLISDTNALLFTPMLAEVAAGSLEAAHISSPLRTSLRRTTVIRGRVVEIKTAGRSVCVETASASAQQREEPYDHVVLALGSVSHYLGMENVEKAAFDLKSLSDAIRLRNHVIALFERADSEPDQDVRRTLLTFVIAGAGFAGVELAGGLNDFARGMLIYYPRIAPDEVRIIVVHPRERILPELSEALAAYALAHMSARGVVFKLMTRVADVQEGRVVLDAHDEIAAHTLVWTAGTAPHPLMRTLPAACDRRGAIIVDPTLAVPGYPGVWALGDCASVPDLLTGAACPPTAQYALRQAKTVAHNIQAAVRGGQPRPFRFKALGALCVIGHQTACAEIRGRCFSGLFAWFLWRAIYLVKLPGLERRVQVLADWIIELFFPRDIVQTLDTSARKEAL